MMPDGNGNNCCLATMTFVVCCTTTRKPSRIKVLWGWLFVLAIISAVFLGCVLYRPYIQYDTPSDMRAVTENVRYLFCEMVAIQSPGPSFDAYRVDGHLRISNERQILDQETALFINNGDYDFFSFYFLPDSELTVNYCSKGTMIFFVFKGQDNFDAWKENHSCQECYLMKVYMDISETCETLKQKSRVRIYGEDQYFIVYSSENDSDNWVNVEFHLSRTVYNLTDAYVACTGATSCNVLLEKNTQIVVFQVNSYYDLGTYNHPQFVTSCVPRMWSYLILHGFGVLIFGIIGTIFLQKCGRTTTNSDPAQYERTPLLGEGGPPPTYSSIANLPPKYEDVMRQANIDPPSYTEVLSILIEQEAEVARSQVSGTGSLPETNDVMDRPSVHGTPSRQWRPEDSQSLQSTNSFYVEGTYISSQTGSYGASSACADDCASSTSCSDDIRNVDSHQNCSSNHPRVDISGLPDIAAMDHHVIAGPGGSFSRNSPENVQHT